MQVLEISFRGIPKTPYLEDLIRRKAAKLEQVNGHLMSCRVAVDRARQHPRAGNPVRVRIDLKVPPGHEFVVKREFKEGDEELSAALREVFEAARRQLQEFDERLRGEVKVYPEAERTAFVKVLFREKGFGFLQTPEGRDIYFHRHSVLHGDFDRLEIGTGVRFEEEIGEKGPQATTVQIVDKPGVNQ